MIEISDRGNTRVLTICRPQRRNALDETTVMQLRQIVAETQTECSIRAVVITGEGELAFCSGSDMKAAQEMTVDQRIEHARHGQQLMDEINQVDVLTIAAVEGFALGGGFELALACDLIVASESGKFGLPEVQRQAIPSWGGTYRVTKAVGLSIAKNMLLGGRIFSATELHGLGLIYQCVAPTEALDSAITLANTIAQNSQRSILAEAKKLLNEGAYRTAEDSSDAEFEAEQRMAHGEQYGSMS